MKKIANLILVFALLGVTFFTPLKVEAKTLGDLKVELTLLEKDYNDNIHKQELTKEEINAIKAKIVSAQAEIDATQREIIDLADEIEILNNKIEKSDADIKKMMNYYQISKGDPAVISYATGATDFTDFIFRLAVSEQFTKYSDNLISSYNAMIEVNKQKSIDLEAKKVDIASKQANMKVDLDKLSYTLESSKEEGTTILEDIELQREAIKLYQDDLGCRDDEDIKICGRNALPPETSLWRPTQSGRISSDYGNRCFTLNGDYTCNFHAGIDIAESGGAVPIYSAGKGMVVAISYKSSCGGNMIFIHHNVDGVSYTTVYGHLRTVTISAGDIVDRNTQIGTMGGTPSTETWDRCSTGQHLHFQIGTGLMYKDYYSWSTYASKSFNPRSIVNFPPEGSRFSDKTTKY